MTFVWFTVYFLFETYKFSLKVHVKHFLNVCFWPHLQISLLTAISIIIRIYSVLVVGTIVQRLAPECPGWYPCPGWYQSVLAITMVPRLVPTGDSGLHYRLIQECTHKRFKMIMNICSKRRSMPFAFSVNPLKFLVNPL